MTNRKELDYGTYLSVDSLLDLQKPRSSPPEHDEMLFIIIHQVYELWFKQIRHEIGKLNADLSAGRLFDAIHTVKRCRTIMKTLVAQLDILETMTPMSFLSFRDRLDSASGFQSVQFRIVEFELGYRRASMIKYHAERPAVVAELEALLKKKCIHDHLHDFLEHQGATIPAELRHRDLSRTIEPSQVLQKQILQLYRERGELAILFELLMDFDEGLQEWRYRHVKIVERTIGAKPGTGGSPGVEFLKQSLFKPLFADLWEIRKQM